MKKQIKTRFGYIHWGTSMFIVVFLFFLFIGILVLFSPIWDETSTSDLSEYAQAAINLSTDSEEEKTQDAIDSFSEDGARIFDIVSVVLVMCMIMSVVGVVYSWMR